MNFTYELRTSTLSYIAPWQVLLVVWTSSLLRFDTIFFIIVKSIWKTSYIGAAKLKKIWQLVTVKYWNTTSKQFIVASCYLILFFFIPSLSHLSLSLSNNFFCWILSLIITTSLLYSFIFYSNKFQELDKANTRGQSALDKIIYDFFFKFRV